MSLARRPNLCPEARNYLSFGLLAWSSIVADATWAGWYSSSTTVPSPLGSRLLPGTLLVVGLSSWLSIIDAAYSIHYYVLLLFCGKQDAVNYKKPAIHPRDLLPGLSIPDGPRLFVGNEYEIMLQKLHIR